MGRSKQAGWAILGTVGAAWVTGFILSQGWMALAGMAVVALVALGTWLVVRD